MPAPYVISACVHHEIVGTNIRSGLGLSVRLYHLAMWRTNAFGHAEFGMGELANLLGRRTAGGAVDYPNPATVSKAVQNAIRDGLVDEMSRVRCVVLPQGLIQNTTRRIRCRWHDEGA